MEALEYTWRFKRLVVGVIFINDNIDTRENDGELRLAIMVRRNPIGLPSG